METEANLTAELQKAKVTPLAPCDLIIWNVIIIAGADCSKWSWIPKDRLEYQSRCFTSRWTRVSLHRISAIVSHLFFRFRDKSWKSVLLYFVASLKPCFRYETLVLNFESLKKENATQSAHISELKKTEQQLKSDLDTANVCTHVFPVLLIRWIDVCAY